MTEQVTVVNPTSQVAVQNKVVSVTVAQAGVQGPTGEDGSLAFEALAGETILEGAPVYIQLSTGQQRKANASAYTTSRVAGLSKGVVSSFVGEIEPELLTMADWTAVTGAAALVSGNVYFLDTVAGHLTLVPPAVPGQCIVQVGIAVAADTLLLKGSPPVLL